MRREVARKPAEEPHKYGHPRRLNEDEHTEEENLARHVTAGPQPAEFFLLEDQPLRRDLASSIVGAHQSQQNDLHQNQT